MINQLIEQILLRGTKTPAGSYTVTFGILFQETADIFDALVGILKTAKKYSVLSFNKDQPCNPKLRIVGQDHVTA